MKGRHRPNGWVLLTLTGIVAVAAVLRLVDLDRHGLGNVFYASSIRSMGVSWHNFLYAAYDPLGTLNVDKPPVALWLQVVSTKLFGFNGTAIIAPIALAGVATVPLTFIAARQTLGDRGALLAAAVIAVFPEAVGTARDSTMDAMLSALLAVGAIVLMEAVERRPRLLVIWAVLMGVAFNVKFLEALVVLPAAAVYVAARWGPSARDRVPLIALTAAVGILVGLSWVAVVDLTPAEHRPHVMNDDANSELGLVLRYNGIDRVLPGNLPAFQPVPEPSQNPLAGTGGAFGSGPRRPWRPFVDLNGALLGTTTLLASVGVLLLVWRERRRLLDSRSLFWIVWGLTGLALFTGSTRAPVHYIEGSSVALAVLAGAALHESLSHRGWWSRFILPALVAVTAGHFYWQTRDYPAFANEAAIAAASVLALAAFAALTSWTAHRAAGPARLVTAASVLALPAVVAWWIAFEAPTGYQITLPNPLANARATHVPPNAGLIPIEAMLALPVPPGARYRFAIDGVVEAGEVIALTGESVLPIWSEFQRDFAIPATEIETLIARGDVPYVLLSRERAALGLLDATTAFVDERCTRTADATVGRGWALWACPSP